MSAPRGLPGRTQTRDGWYVYGVIAADTARDGLFAGVGGVAGAVSLVQEGSLAAIVSTVPLAEFGEEELTEHLRDPAWLEQRVRAHESVLEAALKTRGLVPFRFGTIYRDEDRVREMLVHEAEALAGRLDRVRGKLELGVKGFLAGPAQAEAEPQAEVSAGRRYLEGKQQARRLAEEQEALRGGLAQSAHERLAAVAEEAVANPLQSREVSGRAADMFLNGAYLVADARQDDFRRAVSALAAEHEPTGASFELTGPWPPYNFVDEVS